MSPVLDLKSLIDSIAEITLLDLTAMKRHL